MKRTSNFWAKHHDTSYRSGLEDTIADLITSKGISVHYETHALPYVEPESKHKYTPDFILPNGIIIETKGRFTPQDRKKMLYVTQQHPDLDIRMVFNNPNARISKTSKTTYGSWCEKNHIQYSAKVIPDAWFKEKLNAKALEKLKAFKKKG